MDRTFSNTDAAICGALALIELIFVFVYLPISTIRLHKRIVAMGRFIPAVPVVIVGGFPGQIYTPGHTVLPNTYPPNQYYDVPPNTYPPNVMAMPQPSTAPPPPGFHKTEDLPPPYSSFGTESKH